MMSNAPSPPPDGPKRVPETLPGVPEALADLPEADPLPTDATLFPRLYSPNDAVREDAWRQFDRLYTPLLKKWAGSFGHHGDDNDELVQLVKTEFFQRSQAFVYDPQKGRFRSLLKSILRLQGANLARQRLRHRGPGGEGELPQVAAADFDLDAAWEVEVLHEAVVILEKRYRAAGNELCFTAFRRLTLDNQAPTEVAGALNLSMDQVYQYKSRVLRQLGTTVKQLSAELG